MYIIKPSCTILDDIDGEKALKKIEAAGRTCYKSSSDGSFASAKRFTERLITCGHESVLEHVSVSVLVVCDRGVSHELVRHRIASYSQESTRYCNYGKRSSEGVGFIAPSFWKTDRSKMELWEAAVSFSERAYLSLLEMGASPEEARSVLPNSLKTEIVVTMNLRAWRNFFKLRTDKRAHPQMREVAGLILSELKSTIPVVFDDFE